MGFHSSHMGFRLSAIARTPRVLLRRCPSASKEAATSLDIPRGYLPVYVGENQKNRYVIPISYLNQPAFQDLLTRAEEEFGYQHPMGGLTIPCREDIFFDVVSNF